MKNIKIAFIKNDNEVLFTTELKQYNYTYDEHGCKSVYATSSEPVTREHIEETYLNTWDFAFEFNKAVTKCKDHILSGMAGNGSIIELPYDWCADISARDAGVVYNLLHNVTETNIDVLYIVCSAEEAICTCITRTATKIEPDNEFIY